MDLFEVVVVCTDLLRGQEATDTGLAYAPVSQAHGHHHSVQCFALLHSSTDQFSSAALGEGGGGGVCILGEPLSGPAGRHLAVVNSTRPIAVSATHRSLTGGSPRLMTCELSRVRWLRCCQHNTHHMTVHKKRRRSLPRAENRPQAPFAKSLREESAE